jgi:hypothetical protein
MCPVGGAFVVEGAVVEEVLWAAPSVLLLPQAIAATDSPATTMKVPGLNPLI